MYSFSYLFLLSVSDFQKVKVKGEIIELSYSSIEKFKEKLKMYLEIESCNRFACLPQIITRSTFA